MTKKGMKRPGTSPKFRHNQEIEDKPQKKQAKKLEFKTVKEAIRND